jgi:hypothetical protein
MASTRVRASLHSNHEQAGRNRQHTSTATANLFIIRDLLIAPGRNMERPGVAVERGQLMPRCGKTVSR